MTGDQPFGLRITPGRLHFRLLTGSAVDITSFAGSLESRGIAVRVLEQAYGVGAPAVRISAPRRQDRQGSPPRSAQDTAAD